MVRLLLLIAAIAMAAAQVQAIVLHIDEATCHSLGVTMDVTYSELAVMPPYATVSVQSQTKVVRMPNIMAPATKNPSLSAMQVSFTLQFVEPFIFPSGMYNATMVLTSQVGTSASLATFQIPGIQFMGCDTSARASTAPTIAEAVSATASLDAAYTSTAVPVTMTTATSSAPYEVPYYPPSGLSSIGIFYSATAAPLSDDVDGGLSVGAKIGIAVAVLGTALAAIIAALIIFVRRHRRASHDADIDGARAAAKAHRHVSTKWVADQDRNSQELKEVSSPTMASPA